MESLVEEILTRVTRIGTEIRASELSSTAVLAFDRLARAALPLEVCLANDLPDMDIHRKGLVLVEPEQQDAVRDLGPDSRNLR